MSPYVPAHLSVDDPWRRCYVSFLIHVYDAGRSEKTLKLYSLMLHHFFSMSAHGGPPKRPHLYTREDVEYFIMLPFKRVQELSPKTRNFRLSLVSSFYTFASSYLVEQEVDARFIGASPQAGPPQVELVPLFRGVSPTHGIKRVRTYPAYRAMSYEDLAKFFAVIPADTVGGLRDRAIFACYFWTARRRSEIARLRWGDLEYGMIYDEYGRGHEGWMYHFVGKGKYGQDDIAELPAPCKEAIDAYLEASARAAHMQADSALFLPLPSSRYLDPKKPLSGKSILMLFKAYCQKAGLDTKRLVVHSFRHTAAQMRYEHGEDLLSLQRLLRHQSVETTRRYLETMMGAYDQGAHVLMQDDKFLRLTRDSVGGD